MKIYDKPDKDGHCEERDWAWLLATFGQAISLSQRPYLAQPGYQITELRAKDGPCTLVARVLDANGAPLANLDVARWWADPKLFDLPTHLAYWRPRGVFGPTNPEGDIGFGMGEGDGYDPAWPVDELPVSEIWCRDNSDRIHGLGWIWATNHLHIDVTFQLTDADEPPPPGDDVPTLLRRISADVARIAELVSAPK
jgi:hypothetical protein